MPAPALVNLTAAGSGGFRYRHGWIKISTQDIRLQRDRKAAQALSLAQAHPESSPLETEIRHNEIGAWSRKLYHPTVAFAHDENGKILGHIIYEHTKGGPGYDDEISIHDLRATSEARGKGVGRALVEHVKQVTRDNATSRKKPTRMRVYNMLESAKPFYAATGAAVSPEHHVGEWVDLSHPGDTRAAHVAEYVRKRQKKQTAAFKRGEDAACTSDAPSPKRSLARKLIRSRKETP